MKIIRIIILLLGYIFRKGYIRVFVFLMAWVFNMEHYKTICQNTLFIANAYLPSYIPSNVQALITFIVHYF